MKERGSGFKHLISMVTCMTRAKCIAVRSKTDSLRARLMLTSLTLLSKKKNLSIAAITAKINHIFHNETTDDQIDDSDDPSKAIVLYSCKVDSGGSETIGSVRGFYDDDDDDDKYPDLRHSLFEEEEEKELAELLEDPNSSVSAIDMVKNSKESGENFNLEDEIDEVADLFITKFHKRMRLQKLLSFKRYQQTLERSD